MKMGMREWMRSEGWVKSWGKTEGVGRKDWGREDCEWGQWERARRVEIGKGWCAVCRRKKREQKKSKGKNRRMSQSEESFRKCWEWEEEKILGIEE